MRRDNGSIKLMMAIVTLCYWVCQNGVEGYTLKNLKSEGDNYEEENIPVDKNKKLLKRNEKNVESTDNTENINVDTSDFKTPDSDSDASSTLYERAQEMSLKLSLQYLAAKYGISESLDKARRGSSDIYDGAKDAIKTVTDFVGEGIGNARFLLFGTK